MKGAAADILKESQRVLDLLAKEELTPDDKEWIHKVTVSGYENHINPGILEYRKAVSTDYTSIEWSDNANGFT
ncbi:MAG: putrescine aminotransferase, partial [Elusimicrobia bacterium]|nr:putrescine aminotransferase [Elusimicrobiota bacterium]